MPSATLALRLAITPVAVSMRTTGDAEVVFTITRPSTNGSPAWAAYVVVAVLCAQRTSYPLRIARWRLSVFGRAMVLSPYYGAVVVDVLVELVELLVLEVELEVLDVEVLDVEVVVGGVVVVEVLVELVEVEVLVEYRVS